LQRQTLFAEQHLNSYYSQFYLKVFYLGYAILKVGNSLYRNENMDDIQDLGLRKELVRKQACFSQLDDTEVHTLATLLHEKNYPKETTIVTEGDYVDSVYLIVTGKAEVRHITLKNGQLHVKPITILSAPDAIGLSQTGFYSLSGLRTASVVALTDVTAYQLSVAAFNGFALAFPHVNEMMRKNPEEQTVSKS
jgi:signal-transduction protein with cAMP-binding, CBS, and nucleotidyltransferase domain